MKKICLLFAAISVVFLGAAHCVLAQGIQFTKTTLAVGSGPSFVLPADLLGTGLPDLICPNFGFRYGCLGDYGGDGSNLTFWINNGQGGFSSSATIQVGDPDLQASLQPEPVCLAAADFNGTGKLDLVVENFYYNTLGIYTNAVTGFKEAKGLSSFGRQPIYITTADVNGDGKPDILTVNNFDQDNNLSIITNGGNYNFDIGTNLPVGSGPVYLAVGDFNGDGKPDLACANYGYCGDGNTLTIYTNAGQGHFSLASTPTVGYGPTCVVAADVNGDGKIDLITANQADSTLSVLINDGHGNFSLKTTIHALSPSSIVATNISGSGHVDLACANSDNGYPGSVTIFLNDGHGNFTSNNIVMLGTGSVENYPDGLAAADFNGDGKMDLVVANFGTASLTVLTQEGSGRPTNGQPPSVSITNPTNGASFLTTQGFAIEATATSAKGISTIVYFLDGNPVGTNTTAPYNFQVTPNSIPAGGHNLEVTAADSAGLVSTSAVVHITVNGAGTSLIDFDALDASAGAVGGATLANYLAGYGVTVADVTGGAVMEAVDTNSFTGNLQVLAPSSPNVFTETGVSGPLSFTLRFAAPLQSFGFTRAGLIPQTGLATHPQWTATALSADGTELSSVSEALIISQREVPARSLSLIGNGIAAVRFDSDSQQTAAFPAVLLDNLVLNKNAATDPLSVALSVVSPATNDIVPDATIVLNAKVTDQLSSSFYVSFFAGATFLGTVASSNRPYQIVFSNVLSGTYQLQARLVDSSGYSVASPVVPITVQLPPSSKVVNFDALNTSQGPVEGAALSEYLAGFGVTVSSLSSGTTLLAANQQSIGGGSSVQASSPPNILTQTGPAGPMQFTLSFTPLLTQLGFTRPELLANPFVSHPAWQVTAFDGAGNVVGQVGEDEIDSSTNVGAQAFSIADSGGPGIAKAEFSSAGSGLLTFNAMLVDDLVLTTNNTKLPPAVAITQPVSGRSLAAPPALTITANAADAAGIAQVSFYANRTLLGTATASPYTITWPNPPVGSYALKAVASNIVGLTNASARVNVVIAPSAAQFAISSQPATQTVAAGSSVTFAVGITGTNSVSYQWSHNGTLIPGATHPTLVLAPPIQDSAAGTYTVAVTSGRTTLTSDAAELTVQDPPVFTLQPQRQTVAAGTTVVLSAAASGGPLTWQWVLNGVNIPGETNSTFVIPSAQPLRSGNYQVVAANEAASALSAVAPVIVETPTTIPETNNSFATRASINPLLGSVSDSNYLAAVQAGGGNSIWFTWHANFTGTLSLSTQGSDFDTLLTIYTGTSLSKLKVVAADSESGGFHTSLVTFNVTSNTDYQIQVSGNQGATGRVVFGLPAVNGYRVLKPSEENTLPVIVRGPVSQVVAPNARVALSVEATSPTPLACQWHFQGAPIPGAVGSTLVINHLQPGSVGTYDVLVANSVGSVRSEPATLQIAVNEGGTVTAAQPKPVDTKALVSPASLAYVIRPSDQGGDVRGFSVSQVFSTVGATGQPGEPAPCGQIGGAPEWFAYTTPAPGTLLVNTYGSSFNTLLGVYTGSGTSFSNLVEVGCGYTTDYEVDGQPSVVLPNVDKGTTYYIQVDGYRGASGVVQLQIGLGQPLSFSAVPPSQGVTAESSATLKASASGSKPFSYQWQLNGVNLPGATKPVLTIANATLQAAGNYTVIASNALGEVTSSPPASLTVQYAPAIVSGPSNLTVTAGQPAKFIVSALGVNVKTNPLLCQWYFNKEPLPNATSLTLSFPVARSTNSGTYYVVLSNSYGSVTSSNATLTVLAKASPAEADDSSLAQTYSGLFYPTDGATLASSGFFTATLGRGANGAFSANLLLDGGRYPLAGTFDSSGQTRLIVPRAGKTPVTLSLRVDSAQMSGVVSNADWCSILQAGRASFAGACDLTPEVEGHFALVMPSGGNVPIGHLSVNTTPNGTALVSGTLADGARLFRAAPMAKDNRIPLYAPLCSGKGMFLGWITLTNSPGETNFGNPVWIQPGSTNATSLLLVK